MYNSTMPVEVWCDLLEEEGKDVKALREWIKYGLFISGVSHSHINLLPNCGCGYGAECHTGSNLANACGVSRNVEYYGKGCGEGYGYGYTYGSESYLGDGHYYAYMHYSSIRPDITTGSGAGHVIYINGQEDFLMLE